MSLDAKLKAWAQYPLPHHTISRLIYHATRLRHPLTPALINWFVKQFDVDLTEAANSEVGDFSTFNTFFTRSLADNARPLANDSSSFVWPADGKISALGQIENSTLLQAKGHTYSVESLIADDVWAGKYNSGSFATIYLSPRDYHRVHIPRQGRLLSMTHVPGRLFSVAPHTVDNVPSLFARNERVIAHFESPQGAFAVVWVGAMNVGAIETVWAGLVTPEKSARLPGTTWLGRKLKVQGSTTWRYAEQQDGHGDEHGENKNTGASLAQQDFSRGEEIGRFNMGSTVILLTENPLQFQSEHINGGAVKMGQSIGKFR